MLDKTNPDCIIIGHHEIENFQDFEAEVKKTQNYSALYMDIKANTVWFRGKRTRYMTLLNEVLSEVVGRDPQFDVCDLPHVGVIYLKNFLYKKQINVEMINYFNKGKEKLKYWLINNFPKAVVITTTLYTDFYPIQEIISFVKQYNFHAKIIVGGPYIFNVCAKNNDWDSQDFIFETIGADIYINEAQGELALSQVIDELRKSKEPDFSSIANLIYKSEDNTFKRTQRVIEENSLDENNIDWLSFKEYLTTPTGQLRTARSCSFKCAFCQYPIMAGSLSLTNLEVVENELKSLKELGLKNIMFIDDTFNIPLPRFKKLCRIMIENEFNFNWFSFFRCANADDEAFDLMRESGCKGVFLGIESGDQTVLTNMNKLAEVEKYKYGICQLRKRGIITYVSLIVGFPGETEETVQNTINFIEETSPTFYHAELYYHNTNAPIQQQAEKYRIRGAGYSWQHNTMNWKQGCEMLVKMYRTIKNSTVVPAQMFDFWAIPYLMGEGFSLSLIEDFAKISQEMLLKGFDEEISDTSDQERRLINLFRSSCPQNWLARAKNGFQSANDFPPVSKSIEALTT